MPQVGKNILSKRVTTDITSEFISVDDVKLWGSIAYTDYDALLAKLITNARIQIEDACEKVFGVKTVQVDFTHSGNGTIRIPFGPVDTVTTLMYRKCLLYPYVDSTEVSLTYEITNDRFAGPEGYYMMTFETTAALVTEPVKNAIAAQAYHLFKYRDYEGKVETFCKEAKELVRKIIPGDLLL